MVPSYVMIPDFLRAICLPSTQGLVEPALVAVSESRNRRHAEDVKVVDRARRFVVCDEGVNGPRDSFPRLHIGCAQAQAFEPLGGKVRDDGGGELVVGELLWQNGVGR